MPEYQPVVDDTLRQARETLGAQTDEAEVVALAFDRLAITFGLRILEIIPGRVSTEVDARLSWDTEGTIAKARDIIAQYQVASIGRERVLIKIASTWEGIRAAERLEAEGIHCNLTLLFGLHQAVAAAEAGVTLISPFVGRILDWYKKDTGRDYAPTEDPGVLSVTRIYQYYKKFGHPTEIMGASFRNAGEIIELAGCDLLTISPALLKELSDRTGNLERKLDPTLAASANLDRLVVDKDSFDRLHAADRMASDKLAEGIQGFTKALENTQTLLARRLRQLEGDTSLTRSADRIFLLHDINGDGYVSREEWLGTDAVFDAMDADHDGRISLAELRSGLGALINLALAA